MPISPPEAEKTAPYRLTKKERKILVTL